VELGERVERGRELRVVAQLARRLGGRFRPRPAPGGAALRQRDGIFGRRNEMAMVRRSSDCRPIARPASTQARVVVTSEEVRRLARGEQGRARARLSGIRAGPREGLDRDPELQRE
jgi:hypothetical protein